MKKLTCDYNFVTKILQLKCFDQKFGPKIVQQNFL